MSDWAGQDIALAELAGALEGDRLHHAWLLAGPEGIGKAGIAIDFAKRLLGAAPDIARDAGPLAIAPADPVAAFVDAQTHPDLNILRRLPRDVKKGEAPNLARNITVDQVRSLSRFLHLAPSMAERRIVVIDAAEDMERAAANALLKNLEEPPGNTMFMLISHRPGRLLPTIRSRCRLLPFQRLDDAAMEVVMTHIAADMPEAERRSLVLTAEGSPGRALAMRDLDLAGMAAALGRIAATGDPAQRERIALARALAPKAAQARYEAFIDLVPHYIADHIRREAASASRLTDIWSRAIALGQGATTLSLDPSATIFALCGTVADLAEHKS